MPESKLHLIYAAPASGKGGRSFDLAGVRWRPDGETTHDARAIAHRMAFTWNMAEGVPTEALEAGVVAEFYETAALLAEAVEKGTASKEACDLAKELRRIHDAHRFEFSPNGTAG